MLLLLLLQLRPDFMRSPRNRSASVLNFKCFLNELRCRTAPVECRDFVALFVVIVKL